MKQNIHVVIFFHKMLHIVAPSVYTFECRIPSVFVIFLAEIICHRDPLPVTPDLTSTMLWQSIRMLLPVCRRCGSPQAARFSCLTSQTENRLSTDPNPSDAGENTDNAVSMAHVPVMVNEVLQLVKPREGQVCSEGLFFTLVFDP